MFCMRHCTIRLYSCLIQPSCKYQSSIIDLNWRNNRRQHVTKGNVQGEAVVPLTQFMNITVNVSTINSLFRFIFKRSSCFKISPPLLLSCFCEVITRFTHRKYNTRCSHYKELFLSTLASAYRRANR